MTTEEALKACTIETDTLVKLPNIQLDRKVYLDLNKKLKLIGGKWTRKLQGFDFPVGTNLSVLLGQVQQGEDVNLQKKFQFFQTPPKLADEIVEMAEIKDLDFDKDFILEPSAGQGAIVKAIHRLVGPVRVFAFEAMEVNRIILQDIPMLYTSEKYTDFLEYDGKMKFDRIIGNPPFSKNQDIDHLEKMVGLLKPGGIVVCITSNHYQLSMNKKETAFREFLDEHNAEKIKISMGAFKESGTMVGGQIIKIIKE